MRMMFAVAFALVGLASPVAAQTDFPNKPVRLLVGFPPGGSSDVLARALGNEVRGALGQEVVIINRPGATGSTAIIETIGAPADGYTIAITPSTVLTLAHNFINIRPDLLEASTPLMLAGRQRIGIATKADSHNKSLKDLMAEARANPGKVSIGIPGVGTKVELLTRAVAQQEKVEINIVPLGGDAPVATNILGGHIAAGAMAAAGFMANISAGSMRLLASYEHDRYAIAKDVPTLRELGYPFEGAALQYLLGPKDLPAPVVKKLVDAFTVASKAPAFIDVATKNGLYEKDILVGKALDDYLKQDRATNVDLVAKLGLKKAQ